MNRRAFLALASALATSQAWVSKALAANDPAPQGNKGQETEGLQAFTLEQLLEEREESGRAYLPFLTEASMSLGIYYLPAGAFDGQPSHDDDEIYLILSGKAVLDVDGEEVPVEEGSLVFVGADVPHRFRYIEEDLTTLVFFGNHSA